ncbi:MAG: hypothetical protein IT350_08580 [Deltaproteobacteria bacterium]|nr:hypothetical protein [Deltaproteobacteria bacterium]
MTASRPAIHDKIPAYYGDVGNHVLRRLTMPHIHIRYRFDARIDADRLARALRLLADAEPVVGARLVPSFAFPYWRRFAPAELDAYPWVVTKDARDEAEADAIEHDYWIGDRDELANPQISALIVRAPGGDRLVLKSGHVVVDAGGSRELALRVAEIYSALALDPRHVPAVNTGSRKLRQVYRGIGWRGFLAVLRRYTIEMRASVRPFRSVRLPRAGDGNGDAAYRLLRLDESRVEAMRRAGAPMRATLNDVLVAAALRALAKLVPNPAPDAAYRLLGTVDLRRYLPGKRAGAPCNLSSFYWVHLGRDVGATLADTIREVKRQVDHAKENHIGRPFLLGGYLSTLGSPHGVYSRITRKMLVWLWTSGNSPVALTNMGEFAPVPQFDGLAPTEAEMMVPRGDALVQVLGVSGYRGTLTVSCGFDAGALAPETVEAYLRAIDEEIGDG